MKHLFLFCYLLFNSQALLAQGITPPVKMSNILDSVRIGESILPSNQVFLTKDIRTSPVEIKISTTVDSVRVGESIPILITLSNTNNDTAVIKEPDFWKRGIYLLLQREGKKKWPSYRWYPNGFTPRIKLLPKQSIIVEYNILELNPFLSEGGKYDVQIYNYHTETLNKSHKNTSNTLSFYLHPASEQEQKEIKMHKHLFGGNSRTKLKEYSDFLIQYPNSAFVNSVRMYYAKRLGNLKQFDKSEEALLNFLDTEQLPKYLKKKALWLLYSVYNNTNNAPKVVSTLKKINTPGAKDYIEEWGFRLQKFKEKQKNKNK